MAGRPKKQLSSHFLGSLNFLGFWGSVGEMAGHKARREVF